MTVASTPNTSRPSIFDFAGRAKWDAWKETGQKYADRRQAEERYIGIAKELGWQPGAAPVPEPEAKEPKGEDDIWDDEDESQARQKSGGGMGNFVSTMQDEENEREETTIHALAIAGNEEWLRTLLETNPELDVNQRDEYVSPTDRHIAAGNIEGRLRRDIHHYI